MSNFFFFLKGCFKKWTTWDLDDEANSGAALIFTLENRPSRQKNLNWILMKETPE
jgi:hypothetical protein